MYDSSVNECKTYITSYVNYSLYNILEQFCRDSKIDINTVVVNAIKEYLQRHTNKDTMLAMEKRDKILNLMTELQCLVYDYIPVACDDVNCNKIIKGYQASTYRYNNRGDSALKDIKLFTNKNSAIDYAKEVTSNSQTDKVWVDEIYEDSLSNTVDGFLIYNGKTIFTCSKFSESDYQ